MTHNGQHHDIPAIIPENLPEDLDGLRAALIASGVNPNTKRFRQREWLAESQGRARARQERAEQVQARGAWTGKVSRFMVGVVNLVAVVFTTVLVLGGLSIGTGLVIWAEIGAVEAGLKIVATDGALAGYAVPIVVFYVVLLFIVEIIQRDSYRSRRELVSLRRALSWAWYVLWPWHRERRYVEERTLLDKATMAVRWMMATQILFGMLGRAGEGLATLTANKSWHEGLAAFLQGASLPVMLGTVGAGVMTVGLLLSIHFITHFIWQVYERLTGGIDPATFFEPVSAASVVEGELVRFYQTELMTARNKARLTSGKPEADQE